MSGKRKENEITKTDDATHVYVKVDKPQGLCSKFEGPYAIVDRPSRSQVTVKIGMKKDGSLRTNTYHWSSCKVAHMRTGAAEGERPKLGRPLKQAEDTPAQSDTIEFNE